MRTQAQCDWVTCKGHIFRKWWVRIWRMSVCFQRPLSSPWCSNWFGGWEGSDIHREEFSSGSLLGMTSSKADPRNYWLNLDQEKNNLRRTNCWGTRGMDHLYEREIKKMMIECWCSKSISKTIHKKCVEDMADNLQKKSLWPLNLKMSYHHNHQKIQIKICI